MINNKRHEALVQEHILRAVLDKCLLNTELYDFAVYNLSHDFDDKDLEVTLESNSFSWNKKRSNDGFAISLLPNIMNVQKIIMKEISFDGRNRRNITIDFKENNVISVLEVQNNSVMVFGSDKIQSVSSKAQKKIYENNKIVFIGRNEFEIMETETGKNGSSREEIVNIFQDRSAVFRENTINGLENSGIIFKKADYFDMPDFNDRFSEGIVYMVGMYNITEKEYHTEMMKLDDKVTNSLRMKGRLNE